MSATSLIVQPDTAEPKKLKDGLTCAASFKDLPDAVLKAIAEVSERRTYAQGETLVSLGQFDGSEFFVVASGSLKAAFADDATGSMLFDTISAGEIFGLAAAVASSEEDNADKLTLTAEEDTEIIAIEVESFRVIVAQRPSLTRNLMHHFARVLAGSAFHAASTITSPERRVYAALLEFVERDAIKGDWRIAKMPKHRELAERADVDEATAASAIAQLIRDDIAHRDYPGLIIADMAQLNRLSN